VAINEFRNLIAKVKKRISPLALNRKKFGVILLAIFFALIFFRLGVWQLDRAHLLQELAKPQAERSTVLLTSVAQPNSALDDQALNRIVKFRGKYIAHLKAPNQSDDNGRVSTWLVGVMQVEGSGKIAVVRGISDVLPDISNSTVDVIGRLVPSQINNKYGEVKSGFLSRVDSALLLSQFGSDFFDGYVISRSEIPGTGNTFERVPSPLPAVKVAGFYWQHISYVVVWWLFALLALAAPFIRANR
jgi:hypothetical protein